MLQQLGQSKEMLSETQRRLESTERALKDATMHGKTKAEEVKRVNKDLDDVTTELAALKQELSQVPTRLDAAVTSARTAAAEDAEQKQHVRCVVRRFHGPRRSQSVCVRFFVQELVSRHQQELLSVRKAHAEEVALYEEEVDRLTARIEHIEKDAADKRESLLSVMVQDKFSEVTAAVNEVHKQRAAEIRTHLSVIDSQKATIRESVQFVCACVWFV